MEYWQVKLRKRIKEKFWKCVNVGANWGPHIRSWTKADGNTPPKAANLGQSFVAINPKHFSECFQDTLSELLDHIRCMEPVHE